MFDEKTLRDILEKNGFILKCPLSDKYFPSCFLVYSNFYKQDFACKIVEKKNLFENEISSLSVLYHSNIVKLFSYFEEDSKYYLILEYCHFGNLRKFIRQKVRPKPSQILKYIQDLTEAIYYCHSNKIAHLDIKPSNILIDKYDRMKLADFGISGYFPDNVCTNYIGTYDFMAPEIKLNQPFDPFKADVWSFGVTIYYLTFGMLPLHTKKDGEDRILFPVCSFPIINKIIQKTLLYDPKQRVSIKQIRSFLNTLQMRRTKTTQTSGIKPVQSTKLIAPHTSALIFRPMRPKTILSAKY